MAWAKDADWSIPDPLKASYEAAHLAVLMDLRDELKDLNNLFRCQNFLAIPHILRIIRKNTTKHRRKKLSPKVHERP
jgi:hypothetical protein